MKKIIAALGLFISSCVIANPGVEYLASGGTLGGAILGLLGIIALFIVVLIFEKIKNWFK